MTRRGFIPVPVRLIDTDWESELCEGLSVCGGTWRLACPFINRSVIERLLNGITLDTLQVVTRFNLADFASGVSDIDALRAIIGVGGHVRGRQRLHSKVFVLGAQRAAVTSANLTDAALSTNVEFGCVSDDLDFVRACDRYVQLLWDRSVGVVVGAGAAGELERPVTAASA
jgi:phosphatidylserine/phosphatidylglycerophosphate/cardiolipin synthase-like enzyme